MAKFKIGDRVRKIKGNTSTIDIGEVVTVWKIEDIHIFKSHEYPRYRSDEDCYELVEKAKQEKEMNKSTAKNWSFESRSIRDIDFDAIYRELSHKNPIALVEAQRNCVVIHKTLLLKAKSAGIPVPNSIYKTSMFPNVFELFDTRPSVIVAWAKNVKNASWPSTFQKKATVKVHLLNI